jgi:hypothetical protein
MIAIINAKIFQKTSKKFETRNILLDSKGIIIGLGYIPDLGQSQIIEAKDYILLPSISDPFFLEHSEINQSIIEKYAKAGITKLGTNSRKEQKKTKPYPVLLSHEKDIVIKEIKNGSLDFFTIPKGQETYYLPVVLSSLNKELDDPEIYKLLVQEPLFFESEKFGLTQKANFTIIRPYDGYILKVFHQGVCIL